ncbi:DUF2868 domain-containing protein [Pseudomonas mangrovi]|uniref:DUF2868 domain-containing protein n=1 Tax=Pseudomonas mangrovi TaxID=2161748 RepID=A0A2T5P5K1_9PSED|nr:DUF2868 domain-containing protein [Pseudomonas mangrovi]PTU73019.1 DUF2868 domain-containing protein [Pseudomonas mangrovi]
MTDSSNAPDSSLQRLWLCEAVRLREEHAGPLEDSEANRLARLAGGDISQMIERRALHLARRDGLIDAQRHWLQGARLAALLLAVLALLGGAALAFAALGDGSRPVNVFWALGSLLGLHLLSLLGWLLGLMLAADSGGALGRLWLWLCSRLARDARSVQLAPALLVLLQPARLTRWGLGAVIHGFWVLALLAALGMLLAMLSARHYGFVWETTLLGADSFVSLTQTLGALPALLGFSLPSEEQIRASGILGLSEDGARQAWAGWLLGVLLVYGLLPRLLLGLFCLWRWRRGSARLRLALSAADLALLRQRLQPGSERLGICDPDTLGPAQPDQLQPLAGGESAVLVAIELDDSRSWPPRLPAGVANAGILDDRQQRQQLLEQLGRFPPARLAIACDPRRSPDRGTLALLGELAGSAAATRVWLLPAPPGEALDGARLADWHQALRELQLPFNDSAPLTWLETGHD